MLKTIYLSLSFALSVAFLVLFILFIAGKNDLLYRVIFGYLSWIKESPILVVLMVFSVVSALCSRIVSFGFSYNIVKNKPSLGAKIFWSAFAVFLVFQLAGLYFLRI